MSAPPQKKRRLPKKVRKTLEYALRQAKRKNCAVDEKAQEAMRLYMDTWIAGPLEDVLSWDDGGETYLDWDN